MPASGGCLLPQGEAMNRVMKRFLLAVGVLTVVCGTVGTYAILSAPSAHAEPCGGRGYPQGGGGSQP